MKKINLFLLVVLFLTSCAAPATPEPTQTLTPEQISSIISTVSALLAFSFSVYVYVQTSKLIKPTERPIMSLFECTAQGEFIENPPKGVRTNLLFLFKNIGKHPAHNMRIKIGFAPKTNPENFKNAIDVSVANRIDVDSVFNWHQSFEQPVKLDGQTVHLEEFEIYVYLLVTYADAYAPKKLYSDEVWLTYKTGSAAPGHATMQEKMVLEQHVRATYHQ